MSSIADLPLRESVIEELHLGTVVASPRPRMKHAKLQSRLAGLLRTKAATLGVVETEVAFRALPEYELRGADVAFVSRTRWDNTDHEDNLRGSPELVIEVLSPSNTKTEMREKAALCLATGALEFWLADPKTETVTVTPRGVWRRRDDPAADVRQRTPSLRDLPHLTKRRERRARMEV